MEAFRTQVEWIKAIHTLRTQRAILEIAIETALEATRKKNNLASSCEALDKAIVESLHRTRAEKQERPILLGDDVVTFERKAPSFVGPPPDKQELTVVYKSLHAIIIDPRTGTCVTAERD